MSTRNVCRTCAKAFRLRSNSPFKPVFLTRSLRGFSSSPRFHVDSPSAVSQSSIPKSIDPVPTGRSPASSPETLTTSTPLRLAQKLRSSAKGLTETYVAYGSTDDLFKECARQADYTVPQALEKDGVIPKTAAGEDLGVGKGWWYEELGLPPMFSTWAQVTFLHMWLLIIRMRCFPADAAPTWHQHLLDHFFYTAEHRMVVFHRISMRTMRSAYLKDLFNQYRGMLAAYDEGLVRGDAVMAAAVWRNIFKADENVRPRDLAVVVSYMRRMAKILDSLRDEQITAGAVTFGYPGVEKRNVEVASRWMKEPFTEGEEAFNLSKVV